VAVAGNAFAVVVAAYLSAAAESVAVAAVVMSLAVAVCPCYSEGQQSAEISLPKQGSLLPPL
jgi:Na+/H+ antiporter NhaB